MKTFKKLLIIWLLMLAIAYATKAQDTLHLKPHPEDHFLADWNESVLCMVDTSGDHEHIDFQLLHKVQGSVTIRIYINGKLYKKFNAVIRKGSSYAFYYSGIIKNARIEYLDKTVYITK